MTAFIVLAALVVLVLAGIIAEQAEQRKRINEIAELVKDVVVCLIYDKIS